VNLNLGTREGERWVSRPRSFTAWNVPPSVPLNRKFWRSKNRYGHLGENRTLLTSAIFWDFTHRRLVTLYRHFGTVCRSHCQGSRSRLFFSSWTSWPLQMGRIRCPEMWVKKLPLENA
jgi:hypothetical protein